MKKNSFFTKNPKTGFIALMMVFCCFFANEMAAQNINYFWGGGVSTSWTTAGNWARNTGRFIHTANFASGDTTITIATANLATTTTVLAVGDAIVGPGIPVGTTVTAFSAVPAAGTTITLSQATTAAGSASIIQTYLKATSAPNNGTSPNTSTAIIDNAALSGPVVSTTGAVANIVILRNNFGSISGPTLTIDSGAVLSVTNVSASPFTTLGGNIVNNGTLSITSTSTAASTGIMCSIPFVPPTSGTNEYTYSGSGTLNVNLSASTTANSAAVNVSSLNAFTTYKFLFDGTANFTLGSANTSYALRNAGGTASSKLIIGGAGFTLGASGPVTGGLLSVGAQSDVTVNSGTVLTMNSAPTNVTHGLELRNSAIGVPTVFTNNGTINILGESLRSGISTFVGNSATLQDIKINATNNGIINVDLACLTPSVTNPTGFQWTGQAAYQQAQSSFAVPAGSGVIFSNNGTLTLRNRSTIDLTGYAIWGSGAGQRLPTNFTNNSTGILNIDGSTTSIAQGFTLTNNGTVNSNNAFASFTALTNNAGASLNFDKTSAIFTVLATAAATEGATYTDANLNVYTIRTTKVNGTGLKILAASAPIQTVPASGVLTLASGTGDATIDYTAVTGVTSNAISSTTTNSGSINTAQGAGIGLSNISSTTFTTSATSILDPGGSTGKGIMNFARAASTILGKVVLQVSGDNTAGVDYDQIISTTAAGSFDITGTILDITGIYLPSAYTVIDILVPNATGTVTGTFASVVGMSGTGWSVVYPTVAGGPVQLKRGTAGVPTITRLSSNGTNTITSACEGSTLVIIGTNLSVVSSITVDGVALTGINEVSATRVEGVLPIGANVGPVAVTTPGGTVTTAGNLTVVENSTVVTAVTACDTYTWANNGQTYTTSGTYTGTTTGCVTQSLVLNIVTTPAPIVTTANQCGGTYTWPSNGVTYSASANVNIIVGCTAETLNLTITAPTTTGSETRNECGTSYTWPVSGQTYTASGTYTHVVGCNTATLTLTLGSPSTTGSETVSACGSSYTWALNGQTYNASGNYDHVVGCNTATLSLTLAPNTTTGSETISQCGGTYTWPVNNVTYSASTTQVVTVGCNVATLNLTITAPTTTGSETISQCGGTYTWPVNSVTYSASATEVVTSGCNTATLNLTITAPTTNGNVTQVQTGGTYTWAANGTTYSTSGIYTHVVGCNTATLDLTINPAASEIPTTFPAFCKGATVATATGTTSMKFYTTLTGGLPLAGTTALATGKTLFVTEVINSVETSPRVPRLITVNVLPATPASMATTDAVLCKYVGTTNTVTYTVATVATATSYLWTIPAGATLIADGNATDNVITVNFLNAPINNTSIGGLGTISARAVNSFDCPSLPRSLVLTAKLPTAPTSLTMTSEDSTPHFDVITTPAVIGVSPAIYSTVGLNYLTKITKVGPYMGTTTEFKLTAPVAPTAASYEWTLPAGVNQLTGGTSNEITVNFAGVASGIGSLPIVVKSKGGCGLSSARTLTLGRVAPGAPKALTLTNTTQSNLSSLAKITKVGPYTGTTIPFTLTATPFRVQGATATSYAWILPSGVTCTTVSTPTTVYQNVNTGTLEAPVMVSTPFAAISTPTNVITVDFSTATGIGNLDLLVFGVNGAANSVARKLVLARALPTAPTALVLRDGTTVVTKVGPYVGETTPLTLTATPFATQGAEATSFTWTLPAGVDVTAGATFVSDNGTTKTWTSTGTVLTINYSGVGLGITSLPLSVQAVNGAGTSTSIRTLTTTSAVPSTPSAITTPSLTLPTYNPACSSTITVQVLNVFGVDYNWSVGSGASITGGQGTNSITIDVSGVTTTTLAISVIGSNGTGSSAPRALTIKRVSTCREASTAIAIPFNVIAYPNPSSDEFTIRSSEKGAMSVKVCDMQGRLVEKSNTERVGSKLAAGAYNVIVNQGTNTKTLRVIKK